MKHSSLLAYLTLHCSVGKLHTSVTRIADWKYLSDIIIQYDYTTITSYAQYNIAVTCVRNETWIIIQNMNVTAYS